MPEGWAAAPVDFWALDATQMPFADAGFAMALMVNVVDCIADPTAMLIETARLTAPGGAALMTTPYDWSPGVTNPRGWFGGHSQRGPLQGRGEPALLGALPGLGWQPVAESTDLPWQLRLHDRSTMLYSLHLIAARRPEA